MKVCYPRLSFSLMPTEELRIPLCCSWNVHCSRIRAELRILSLRPLGTLRQPKFQPPCNTKPHHTVLSKVQVHFYRRSELVKSNPRQNLPELLSKSTTYSRSSAPHLIIRVDASLFANKLFNGWLVISYPVTLEIVP
jgi:hypothetical protein